MRPGPLGAPARLFRTGELPVLAAVAVGMTAVEAVRPAASYRALELQADAFGVGLVAGAFAVLALGAALPLGRAVDRYGERPFLVLGAVLIAVSAAVGLSVRSLLTVIGMQALLGLGQVCLAVSTQAMAGNSVAAARDHRFARLAIAVAAGQLVGPLLSGRLIDLPLAARAFGARTDLALITAGAVGLLAVLLAVVSRVPDRGDERTRNDGNHGQPAGPDPSRPAPIDQRRAVDIVRIQGMPQALYASVVMITTIDLLVAYLPLLGERRGVSASVVGALLATRAAFTVVSRLSMPPLLVRLGRRRLLSLAMTTSAMALAAVAVPMPIWVAFVVLAVGGFGLGLGMPMTSAWVASRAPLGARGAALGLRLTGNRLSQLVVPAVLGLVASGLGPAAVFVAASGALVVGRQLVRSAPMDDATRKTRQG